MHPGPVLSRFHRFLLIGPRAKGGRALLIYLPKKTCTFYRSCLCIVPARAQCFLSRFERPKRFSHFSNDLLKCSINSFYHHHHSTPKLCFTITSVFRWTVAVSQNVFAVSKVKPMSLEGPQYFVSVGSVANANPSVLRGFNAFIKIL